MQDSRCRILLVEDHEDTLQMINLFMGRWGYEVSEARTLADGLRMANGGQFDLYLLDGRLPDGTGLEFCKQVRTYDPKTPILFCSASAYPYNKEQAMEAGAQGYLTKPVELDLLGRTIEELLRGDCQKSPAGG